jgi:hypothetical protein
MGSLSYRINVRENQKGQSRMDNPEKLTTLGTQNTRRRQTKQKTQHNDHNYFKANLNYLIKATS